MCVSMWALNRQKIEKEKETKDSNKCHPVYSYHPNFDHTPFRIAILPYWRNTSQTFPIIVRLFAISFLFFFFFPTSFSLIMIITRFASNQTIWDQSRSLAHYLYSDAACLKMAYNTGFFVENGWSSFKKTNTHLMQANHYCCCDCDCNYDFR